MSYQGAVTTKFLPPTATKGARVKATAYAGSVTLPWDHSKSVKENHLSAVQVLAKQYGWLGSVHLRSQPSGKGYVAVFAEWGDWGHPSAARSSSDSSYRGVFIHRNGSLWSVRDDRTGKTTPFGSIDAAKAFIDIYIAETEGSTP